MREPNRDVSYNILQCLTKSIEVSHPEEERRVSSYYVAGEVTSSHHGLAMFMKKEDWSLFSKMSPQEMASSLLELGRQVD